jgi:hypothetical protein
VKLPASAGFGFGSTGTAWVGGASEMPAPAEVDADPESGAIPAMPLSYPEQAPH